MDCNCAGGIVDPDLHDLRPHHKAIIFDEACAELVVKNKRMFQGLNKPTTLGQSQCNDRTYDVYTYGVMLIVTSNHWEEDLRRLEPKDKADLGNNLPF
jgi:hypothetical protein